MSTPAYDGLLALQAQLQTISIANGYRTDVNAVLIGRDARSVGTKSGFPVISLNSLGDALSDNAATVEAGSIYQIWTRHVALEAVIADDDAQDWEEQADDLLYDVRQCLQRYPQPLRIDGPLFSSPVIAGDHAAFTFSLFYDYELNFFYD